MKNFTIENAKTELFESKEHYLQFRQAWKDFHNSDKLVWREDVEVYSWALKKDVVMKNVKHTALGAEHYMLYNLLRGYDAQRGFKEDSDHGWCACEYAVHRIYRAASQLKKVNDPDYDINRRSARHMVEALLLPFGDTVTHQMLYNVGCYISWNFYNNSNWDPEYKVEEWKTEEHFDRLNMLKDLKNPKRHTLKEKLKAFMGG